MLTNTRKAVHRIKTDLRNGARLVEMNGRTGKEWFLVGLKDRSRKSAVADVIAQLVIREPDVTPNNDGLFGTSQTYVIG